MTGGNLTTVATRGYSPVQVLQNTSNSGMSPRKSVAFFTSIGLSPMGGMERQYKTRKGNTARRLFAVLNILPTPLQNGAESLKQEQTMSRQASGTSVPAVFTFNSQEVRTVDQEGEVWFVASDVARALGYRDSHNAVRNLDDDEKATHILSTPVDEKGTQIVRTPGGDQEVTLVNESGLYNLILRSRKPEAKRFKKWVTSEVLPEIRKTGGYRDTAAFLNQRWLVAFDHTGQQQAKPIPEGSCIVNPNDPAALHTLIYEFVPLDLLPKVIDVANGRMARFIAANQKKKEG
jgi:prophage antirepressor-like protein